MDGWHVKWMTWGLANGATNSLLYIWMEKFGRINNKLSVVLSDRIKSYQLWTRLGRVDSNTHVVVI
jgi:hypothetical protein